jgi:AcrR family transcriptional regulator
MESKLTDSKNVILSAARDLFWKHGFRRVTVEEICEKADISKMTFYRYFPNKFELAKTVLRNVTEEGYKQFLLIMNDISSPEEKIQRILLLKFEGTNDISQEFLMDFYASKENGLSDYVKKITNDTWQKIIEDFRIAQENGIFRSDIRPEFFFLVSQKLMESLNDEKILQLFANPQDMIMESAKLIMYGISPHKK